MGQLSTFLAKTGTVAILYGRFSGSSINPFIYVAWVQQHICRKGLPLHHLERLLQGLTLCLAELEGTAFKSVAPSLLALCCRLLAQSDSPISVFGAILDVMQQLCKVPSAVRDQFIEVVDFVIGWGFAPEVSSEIAPKVRSFFSSLRSHWQDNAEHGSRLIVTIMKDLCNQLDTKFEESEAALVFLNASACLLAIFESCAAFLPSSMFAQILAHVRCMIRALKLIPSIGKGGLDVKEYSNRMASQLAISVEILIQRSVPNAVVHVTKIIAEGLETVRLQPEVATAIIQLHRVLAEKLMHTVEMQGLCHAVYGTGSCLHQLRLSHWKPVVEAIADVYQILLCTSPPSLHLFFTQLFLQDLSCSDQTQGRDQKDQHVTSGGQTQLNSTHQAVHSGSSSLLNHPLSTDSTVLRRQLFAMTLFFRCLSDEKHQDLSDPVWEAVSDLHRDPRELHPLVLLHSVRLIRKAWKVSSTPLPVLDALMAALRNPASREQPKLLLLLLEWLSEVLRSMASHRDLPIELENLLVEKIRSSTTVMQKKALLSVLQVVIEKRLHFTTAENLLYHVYRFASSHNTELFEKTLEVLKGCGYFSLLDLQNLSRQNAHRLLTVVLQPQIYTFKSSQLASLLKKMMSGTMPSKLEITSTDWIESFGQGLSPSLADETKTSILKMDEVSTLAEKSHLLVHEAAKFIVASRFRSIESGPSKLLKIAEECLSDLKQHIQDRKPVDLFHVWLLLEFVSGLQQQTFCGYDGAHFTRSPPQSTWAYYSANKAVFEKGFSRLIFKQLFVSQKCGFHHLAAQLGTVFLQQQCQKTKSYLSELQQCTVPKQTVLKVRQEPSKEFIDELTHFFQQFIEGIQMTCLALIHLSSPASILGLQRELKPFADDWMQCLAEMDGRGLLLWMEGMSLEAKGKFEHAQEHYQQQYSLVRHVYEELTEGVSTEIQSSLLPGIRLLQLFLLKRLCVCHRRVADWEALAKAKELPEMTDVIMVDAECMELEMLVDRGSLDSVVERLVTWQSQTFDTDMQNLSTAHSVLTVHRCLKQHGVHVEEDKMSDTIWNSILQRRHLLMNNACDQQAEILRAMHAMLTDDATSLLEPLCFVAQMHTPDFVLMYLFPKEVERMGRGKLLSSRGLDVAWLMNIHRLASAMGSTEARCAIALILAHIATERDNADHAARLIKSIQEDIGNEDLRLQFAFAAVKCKLALMDGTNDKQAHLMLVHFWNVLIRQVKAAETAEPDVDPSTSEFLSLWLGRFAQILNRYVDRPLLDEALASVHVPDVTHIFQSQYYQQLTEGHRSPVRRPSTLGSVSQIQAYCMAHALERCPKHFWAWKQFSQMLLSNRDNVIDQISLLQNAAKAMAKCLHLCDVTEVDVEILIELFDLLKNYGSVFLDEDLMEDICTISPHIWKQLSSQLFSILNHTNRNVRRCLVRILKDIAAVAPSRILYALMDEWNKEKAGDDTILEEIEELMDSFRQQNPQLLHDVSLFMEELQRVHALLSEEWLAFISDAQLESQVRLAVLNEEIKRIRSQTETSEWPDQLKTSYALVMQPLAESLRRGFREKQSQCCETPFERHYWAKHQTRCEAVIASLEAPLEDFDPREIQKKWAQLKTLLKEAAEEVKLPLPPFDQISPRLASLKDTQIPMPGDIPLLPAIMCDLWIRCGRQKCDSRAFWTED